MRYRLTLGARTRNTTFSSIRLRRMATALATKAVHDWSGCSPPQEIDLSLPVGLTKPQFGVYPPYGYDFPA